jgi:hypothetical protein
LKDGDENPFNLCGFYFKTQTRSLLGFDKYLVLEKSMVSSWILFLADHMEKRGRDERKPSFMICKMNIYVKKEVYLLQISSLGYYGK